MINEVKMILNKENIVIGIFFSALIIIMVYAMYAGVSMIWHNVNDTFLSIFLSLIAIFIPSLFILAILSSWKSSSTDVKAFSKSYKSEAVIMDIYEQHSFTRRVGGRNRGDFTDFGLVLEVKHEDGSSHETKALFQIPARNRDYFKIGKTIVVIVSAIDPNKMLLSNDTFK